VDKAAAALSTSLELMDISVVELDTILWRSGGAAFIQPEADADGNLVFEKARL